MSSQGNNGGDRSLWKAIRDNHDQLLQEMDSTSGLLGLLGEARLLRNYDVSELELIEDTERRNAELLRQVLENDSKVSDSYEKFTDALRRSRQKRLADRLDESGASSQTDRRHAGPSYTRRGGPDYSNSMDVNEYLEREARRANVKYGVTKNGSGQSGEDGKPPKRSRSESPERSRAGRKANGKRDGKAQGAKSLDRSKPSSKEQQRNTGGKRDKNGSKKSPKQTEDAKGKRRGQSSPGRVEDKPGKQQQQRGTDDDQTKMREHASMRADESSLEQLERCRVVIDKLHKDCDDVARKHADVHDKLRHIDSIVQKVLPSERQSRRGQKDADAEIYSPRHKQQDEADRIVSKVRDRLTELANELRDDEQHTAACDGILDKIRYEISERNRILGDNEGTQSPGRPSVRTKSPLPATQASGRLGQLRTKLVNLASEVATYIRREKQLTQQKKRTGGSVGHRNFDQVDHDLTVLQRELRQNDKSNSVQAVQRLADVTRSERGDCIRMIDDLQRLVQKRRLRIQDNMAANGIATSMPAGPMKQSPVLQRKLRDSQTVESNMSRRLATLADEVKLFMEIEFEHGQKFRDEFHRRRQGLDERAKSTAIEIRRLERRVQDTEADAQRYRRLFEQSQVVQSSRLSMRSNKREQGRRGAYSVDFDTSRPSVRLLPPLDDRETPTRQSAFAETPKDKKKTPPTTKKLENIDGLETERRQHIRKYSGTPPPDSERSVSQQIARYIQTRTSDDEDDHQPNHTASYSYRNGPSVDEGKERSMVRDRSTGDAERRRHSRSPSAQRNALRDTEPGA